jgi:hypothetical protein
LISCVWPPDSRDEPLINKRQQCSTRIEGSVVFQ